MHHDTIDCWSIYMYSYMHKSLYWILLCRSYLPEGILITYCECWKADGVVVINLDVDGDWIRVIVHNTAYHLIEKHRQTGQHYCYPYQSDNINYKYMKINPDFTHQNTSMTGSFSHNLSQNLVFKILYLKVVAHICASSTLNINENMSNLNCM